MSELSVRRTLAAVAAGGVLAATGLFWAGEAHASPSNCETIAWGNLLNWIQKRTICDSSIRADGAWTRQRIIWTPAHQVPFSCSYGRYYSSCSGGYFVDVTVAEDMSYPVTAETVLPNEPGHLA